MGGHQNVFTGWMGSVPAGDDSPLAFADYAGGSVTRDGFTSGADNGRTTDTTFTVTYQFPVADGATYTLSTDIWANAGHLFSQQLVTSYSGPGVGGEFARITSSAGWNNAPAGYDQVSGEVTRSTTIQPTSNGLLTVTFQFNLDGLEQPWPTPNSQQNGDISISAPVLVPTSCG